MSKDHLLTLQTENDLAAILDQEGNPVVAPGVCDSIETVWNGEPIIILGVKIVRAPAVLDGAGEIVTPEETAPGIWVVIRAGKVLALPIDPVVVTDSDLAAAGMPYIIAKSDAFDWAALQSTVVPTFCGDDYPFGASVGPEMLVTA